MEKKMEIECNYVYEEFFKNRTPLASAVLVDNALTARLLLEAGADPNQTTNTKSTPLHLLAQLPAREHDLEIAELLLNRGADHLVQDALGRTPLHCAFFKRKWTLVAPLLRRLPKGANPTDSGELSAFHIACALGDDHLVRDLLYSGARIDHCTTKSHPMHAGFSALHFAVLYNRKSTVELLLQRGADPNSTTTSGQTALHIACRFNDDEFRKKQTRDDSETDEEMALRQQSQVDIISLLLDRGADVEATNKDGLTPLLYTFVVPYRHRKDVFFKLENCKKIFAKQHLEIIKRLIDRGASINARHPDGGRTVLDLLDEIEKSKSITNMKPGEVVKAHDGSLWTLLDLLSTKQRPSKFYVFASMRRTADANARITNGELPNFLHFESDADDEGSSILQENIQAVWRILLLHVQRLEILGLSVDGEMRDWVRNKLHRGKIATIKSECVDELARMKQVQLDADTTLYRLLRTGRDGRNRCLDEVKLQSIVAELEVAKMYPHYTHLLQAQVRRCWLLESTEAAVKLLSRCELPNMRFDSPST